MRPEPLKHHNITKSIPRSFLCVKDWRRYESRYFFTQIANGAKYTMSIKQKNMEQWRLLIDKEYCIKCYEGEQRSILVVSILDDGLRR